MYLLSWSLCLSASSCVSISLCLSDWQLTKDQKLLHQLDFDDHQKLTVRATSSVISVSTAFSSQVLCACVCVCARACVRVCQ